MRRFFISTCIVAWCTMSAAAITEAILPMTPGCGQLITCAGDAIDVDLIRLTDQEVVYRRCGKASDPEIVQAKTNILSVKTPDGEVLFKGSCDSRITEPDKKGTEPTSKRYNGFAITAMVLGIFTLSIGWLMPFILVIITGVLAIVFGAIAIVQIRRNPEKWKGKSMSWAGLITGITAIGLFLILLLLLL